MRQLILGGMLMFALVTAEAGPEATANFLINDTVSVLDFGIYKIEQDVAKRFDSDRFTTTVSFVGTDDRIIVIVSDTEWNKTATKTRETAVSDCKSVVAKVRSNFGINPATGKPPGLLPNSYAARYFGHEAVVRSNMPKSLAGDVDRMIRIQGMVSYSRGILQCEAPLLGMEILFAE